MEDEAKTVRSLKLLANRLLLFEVYSIENILIYADKCVFTLIVLFVHPIYISEARLNNRNNSLYNAKSSTCKQRPPNYQKVQSNFVFMLYYYQNSPNAIL